MSRAGKNSGGEDDGIDLLNGRVSSVMWRLTIPMFFGMLAMVLFNLVDTIYVGRLGKRELAAISFSFPVVFFFTSITSGLGVGATSVISRALGAGDEERAARLTGDSLLLSVTVAAVSTGVGLATIGPLFRVLNVKPDLFPLVEGYMEIWYFGILAVVIPMVGNAIIRATGDTKTPMKIMLFAVLVNIILDPLLIFGIGPFPRMELRGAALATVLSRTVTIFLSVYVLVRVKKLIRWDPPTLREITRSWKDVLHVGAPNAVVNALTPLSQGVVTAIVAGFGLSAVAGYGAATRLEAFVIMPMIAFCSALVPFVGQNFGSNKFGRVDRGVSVGYRAAAIYGLSIYAVLALTAPLSSRMFSSDPAVIQRYSYYIWLGGLGWLGLGMCYIVTNAFNAMGRPLPAAALTLVRVFILILFLVYLGSVVVGLKGAFIGLSVANGAAAILAYLWLERCLRKRKRRDERPDGEGRPL